MVPGSSGTLRWSLIHAERFLSPVTSPSPRPAGRALRGDIEGLRAIAVLMVLVYHVHPSSLTGGFAGVDVFFVISGYLITNLLVKEVRRSGTVSIRDFYARRARRLLPAATLVLLFSAVTGRLLLPETRHAELGSDVVAAALYFVNWALAWRSVDYLAEDSDPSLVQHYWSLSVEEQFYIVWPLLILVGIWVARRQRLKVVPLLGWLLALTVAASLVWSVLRTASSPATAYFVTPTRVWELGIGALLVFITSVLAAVPRAAAEAMAAVGLAMVASSAVVMTSQTPWPGSAALVPTVGTALVIAAGLSSTGTVVARLLGTSPMRFVGGLSYGLYLWHWPLLQLLEVARPGTGPTGRVLVALLAVLLAWLTLRLVENPIRFSPSLARSPGRALTAGAAGMLASVLVAGVVWQTAPRVGELREDMAGALSLSSVASAADAELIEDPSRVYTTSGEISPPPGAAAKDVPRAYAGDCQVAAEETEIRPDANCRFGHLDSDVEVALVGDSKMLQWFPALLPIAEQEGWNLKIYTKSACGFLSSGLYAECLEYNSALREHLGDGTHTPDLILTSLGTRSGPSKGEQLLDNLEPAVTAGAQVVFVADNPSPDPDELDGTSLYECVAEHPDDYGACSYLYNGGRGTTALEAAHGALEGSGLVDLNEWICPPATAVPGAEDEQDRCPSVIGRVLIYRQGTHLTASYVRTMTPLLHRQLSEQGFARTPVEQIGWAVPELEEAGG